MSLRDRYLAFIARHEVAWELVFAGLAIVYVVIGFAADDAPPDIQPTLFAVDAMITVVIAGAEEDSRRRLGRGLTREELERVLRRYPGDP